MNPEAMEIVRTVPAQNKFFEQESAPLNSAEESAENAVVNLYDEAEYQEILGFGGAFTEAAAYNFSRMDRPTQERFLTAYFSEKEGIGYNFGRMHINSCDFSLSPYTEVREGDETLSTFSLDRDRQYILPMVKGAEKTSGNSLFLFASPWSPPAYMKDNGSMFHGGSLLPKYKPLWAHYYAKFVKACREEGIPVSAVTVQNEPKAAQLWESCVYSADEERVFLSDYLIPALDEEGLGDLKIIIWDHNKERVYDRARDILRDPAVAGRVWAVGHHWYSGSHYEGLALVRDRLRKPLICTEFCGGIGDDPQELAERYGKEICEDLSHGDIAVCDWNLLLDENGGPFHNRDTSTLLQNGTPEMRRQILQAMPDAEVPHDHLGDGCMAPIMFNTKTGAMTKTLLYYYMGHFSRYVKRGAKLIAATKYTDALSVCAFRDPDASIVCVLMNSSGSDLPALLRLRGKCSDVRMPAHSIATVRIPGEQPQPV